jgi:hypothetical protein
MTEPEQFLASKLPNRISLAPPKNSFSVGDLRQRNKKKKTIPIVLFVAYAVD